jgi:solute carrier family 25 phosphate transporter 3
MLVRSLMEGKSNFSFGEQGVSVTMWTRLAAAAGLLLLWRGHTLLVRRALKWSPRVYYTIAVVLAICKVALIVVVLRSFGFDGLLFGKLFAAGGSCALLMHAVTTPFDVVRTKMQLDPERYPTLASCVSRILVEDGPQMLLQGFGATAVGYFLHGGLKYASYEQFRTLTMALTHTPAGEPLSSLHFVFSATAAELIASTALCPLEAVRIRMVNDRAFARNFSQGLVKIWSEGLRSMYKGWMPLVLKQCPYTLAQFWSYEWLLGLLRAGWIGRDNPLDAVLPPRLERRLSLIAGVLSGLAAAVASQPGDTVLSRINKQRDRIPDALIAEDGDTLNMVRDPDPTTRSATRSVDLPLLLSDKNGKLGGSSEIPHETDRGFRTLSNLLFDGVPLQPAARRCFSTIQQSWNRMWKIMQDLGPRGLFLGFVPRCTQVVLLVSGQFLFYAEIKALFGVPETLGRGATHRH